MSYFRFFLQVGDMTGIRGYFLIALEILRKLFGILDGSKGEGTGKILHVALSVHIEL